MQSTNGKLNGDVTDFLNSQNHPLRHTIEKLRVLILQASEALSENVKWNGPNYFTANGDRLTLKIHPPKQVQLIFHRGAALIEVPAAKLINDDSGLLIWKTNDRAVLSIAPNPDFENLQNSLPGIIRKWIAASP